MNLKKISSALLACVMAGVLFTGCGEKLEQNPEPQEIKLGTLKYLNADENSLDENAVNEWEKSDIRIIKHKLFFFDNLTAIKMAFDAGQIDEIGTYKIVADYLVARDSKLEILTMTHETTADTFEDTFVFAMRAEDTDLKNSVDAQLEAMKNDGTLDNLIKIYITDLKGTEVPSAVEFETFDGAETLKIGVTGDLPPLDFISADGKATGFNTAVLSELGKRLQRNIEIVQINSAARAAALSSGNIDISFWAVVPQNEALPADLDKPQGVEFSVPYFKDELVHIGLKK